MLEIYSNTFQSTKQSILVGIDLDKILMRSFFPTILSLSNKQRNVFLSKNTKQVIVIEPNPERIHN